MEIKENQETEDIKTQNESIHILDLLNPLKEKTTEDLIKLLSLGLLATVIITVINHWNFFRRFGDILWHFKEYKESISYYLIVLSIFLTLSFFFLARKRIAWIGLNIFFIPIIYIYIIQFGLTILWLATNLLFENYSLSDILNLQIIFSTLGYLLLYAGIIIILNKKTVIETFRINKFHKILTYGITLIVIIYWSFALLPDSFSTDNNSRKYLPKDYYKKIDLQNTKTKKE